MIRPILRLFNPGTVIANFKFDKKGRPYYPNQHGYHAALFIEFGPRLMSTGMPTYIWVMDQWVGARVKRRHKLARTPDEMKRLGYMPSEDANQFYVVVVQ